MDNRENVKALVDGILGGRILETFDRLYADDVVMSENGSQEWAGKAVNRKREAEFANGVTFHGAKAGAVLVDGDHSAYEMTLDFTPKGGKRVVQKQAAVQTWRNGKIIREVFYHA